MFHGFVGGAGASEWVLSRGDIASDARDADFAHGGRPHGEGKRVVARDTPTVGRDRHGTARLRESKSGRLLLTLRDHKGGTTAAAFTHDGQQIISTGWDGAAR